MVFLSWFIFNPMASISPIKENVKHFFLYRRTLLIIGEWRYLWNWIRKLLEKELKKDVKH